MSTPMVIFNVIDYGADPTGVNDSASVIHNALSDAKAALGGTAYFPPGKYLVESTITVACDGTHGVNVLGASSSGSGISTINYEGADGTVCFAITGMNWSYWQGIGVNLGGTGNANQVAFDFQVTAATGILGQGNNLMQGCNVNIQGTGGGHIGFRFSQYNSGNPNPYVDQGSNISGTTLLNCTITGDYRGSAPSTSIGMQFGGGEVKPNRVIGCAVGGLGCDYLVGSIASLLSQGVSATQLTLPVDDVTLFKPNGANTRYVVIGQGGPNPEQCTYTGVTTNVVNYPTTAPSLSLISGMSNGVAVFVVITYVGSFGETPGSSQSTLTPSTSQVVQVASPAAYGGATGYNVYVGSASGGPYYLQNATPIPIGTNYPIPGSPTLSGTQAGPVLSAVPGSSDGKAVYVVITYVDQFTKSSGTGSGETAISPQSTLIPPQSTSQQVQVASPSLPPSGNTIGYNVYASATLGGPYYLQNTKGGAVAIGNPSEIPYPLITSSRQPPVVNTTGGLTGTLTVPMMGGRGAGGTTERTWSAGSTVKEYQPGIGVYGGGDDIVWIECDGSNSLRVFYLQEVGGTCYSILGGRWELLPGFGQRFLQTGFIAGTLTQSVTVKAVQLAGFSPPADGNGVIWLLQNANLEWTGGAAWPQSGSYNDGTNGYFLTNNSSGGSYGAVNFRNLILTAGTSPLPWPVPLQNSWPVNADLLLVEGPSAGYATGRYRQIQMASSGALGFFGAPPAVQQKVTGALSQVTDANAKMVLTSIITALTTLGLAANDTT